MLLRLLFAVALSLVWLGNVSPVEAENSALKSVRNWAWSPRKMWLVRSARHEIARTKLPPSWQKRLFDKLDVVTEYPGLYTVRTRFRNAVDPILFSEFQSTKPFLVIKRKENRKFVARTDGDSPKHVWMMSAFGHRPEGFAVQESYFKGPIITHPLQAMANDQWAYVTHLFRPVEHGIILETQIDDFKCFDEVVTSRPPKYEQFIDPSWQMNGAAPRQQTSDWLSQSITAARFKELMGTQ